MALHVAPTSSSWLNLDEAWFSLLTGRALANTAFQSVTEIEARMNTWVSH